jgi:hypothetical protein
VTARYSQVPPLKKRKEFLLAPSRGINEKIQEELLSVIDLFNFQRHPHHVSSSAKNEERNSPHSFLRRGPYSSSSPPSSSFSSSVDTSIDSSVLRDISSSSPIMISRIHDLYPSFYQYSDLVHHRAIIILPYQVSFMSFFEFYRMEIPMIFPSPSLLAKMHISDQILSERSWNLVFGELKSSSTIPRFKNESDDERQQINPYSVNLASSSDSERYSSSFSLLHPSMREMKSDPNDDLSYESVLEWISLSDFYQFPYVLQFSSWKELLSLLLTTNFDEISLNMSSFNKELEVKHFEKWERILTSIKGAKAKRKKRKNEKISDNNNDSSFTSSSFSNLNTELSKYYRVRLDGCYDQTFG